MSSDRKPTAIPLLGQNTDHSFVPAKVRTAVARSGGPERPLSRRGRASLLTATSTMARLRTLGTIVCFVVLFASLMSLGGAAHAERSAPNAQKAAASPPNPFAAFVTEASRRFAVPEHWIRAVMYVESDGKLRARSQKGAMGLMQIMPKTWIELRARYGLGADPYDPRDNILAGAAYIRKLHDRYGAPGFLAAYNAGPRRYENHLATGRPLPDETQAYLATLAPTIAGEQIGRKIVAVSQSLTSARSWLFVVRTASNSSEERPSPGMRPDRQPWVRAVVDLSALVPQSGNLFVRRASESRSQ
ncbi:MAG: lytic transglycosylase domain-containing protein [bacterium]|nr:lytic transglycosylase domain-containing protein [bacterium]